MATKCYFTFCCSKHSLWVQYTIELPYMNKDGSYQGHHILKKPVLTITHNLCFRVEIGENNVYLWKPQFYNVKTGFEFACACKHNV